MKASWGYSSGIDWLDPGDSMRATIRQQLGGLLHSHTSHENPQAQRHSALGNLVARQLDLIYTTEPSSHEVCFADSSEVRPEFRSTFHSNHLIEYCYAIVFSSVFRKRFKDFPNEDFLIPAPPDASFFWKMIRIGNELGLLHLQENIATSLEHQGLVIGSKELSIDAELLDAMESTKTLRREIDAICEG
jgi:hypothetical protein